MNAPSGPPPSGSTAGTTMVPPPLPAGRRAVLYAVRRLGDATAEQVAVELDMTPSGARQHLVALQELGLLALSEPAQETDRTAAARARRGRPTLAYHVTELADALFPKAYAALTNELLGYLDDEPGQLDRLFARRREQRIERAAARLATKRSFAAKVTELARILDEDGYLATVEIVDRDRALIVEHNCAIAEVARRYGQACSSELEFLRAVMTGTTVERTSHMILGARHCGYEIRRH